MKKILLILGVTSILLSCDKLKELASTNFGLNGDAIIVKVPPSGGSSTISFESTTETIDFDAKIKENNAELAAKFIKSVTINSMDLEIISPMKALPNNFKNIKSYTFTVHSDVKPDKITIKSPADFAPNETKINLPVNTTLDIKDYVKEKTKFTYIFTGVIENPTTDTLEVKIKANYQIKVGL